MKYTDIINRLLSSSLTSYRIAKDTGNSTQFVDNYRSGSSKVENMALGKAEKLVEYQLKLEELKMKKEKLTVNNLYFSHYEDGLHILEFEVDGKKVFVKNIDVDVDGDEDYWDDAENVRKAVAGASDSDIEEIIEWDTKQVQEKVTEYLESLDEEIRDGLYDIYLEKEYDGIIIGIWLEPAGMAYQGDAWESELIGQVEDGEIMNMDI